MQARQFPYLDHMERLLELAEARRFPRKYAIFTAAAPVVMSALLLIDYPTWYVAGLLLLALAPWLYAVAAGRCPPNFVGEAVTITAVAFLMARWHEFTDLSLMLLVLLIGESGFVLRTRDSAAVWLASTAVPVGWQIAGDYNHSPAWVIGFALAWGCGVVGRTQQLTMQRLRDAQEELARNAVADERRRIAREVHDLAAHSMAVTMLHLTGARLALADGEVDEAEAALAAAERLGRSSMNEIRSAVGVLAGPDDAESYRPEPDARDIAGLIDDYRNAGVNVSIVSTLIPGDIDAVPGLALFRLLQESLANATRHAPGTAVAIELTPYDGNVAVSISNPVTTDLVGHGHGLAGMRERVKKLGGELTVGAVDGLWCVQARIPARLPLVADAQ